MPGFLERLKREKEASGLVVNREYEIWKAQADVEAEIRNRREEKIIHDLEASREMFGQTQFLELAKELQAHVGEIKLGIVRMNSQIHKYPGSYGLELIWNKRPNVESLSGGYAWYDQLQILVSSGDRVLGIGKKTQSEDFGKIVSRPDLQVQMLERAYSNPQHVKLEYEPYAGGL